MGLTEESMMQTTPFEI